MVSEAEIKKVAGLMKIRISDHHEYVEKIQDIIHYFDKLDDAAGDGDILTIKIPLEQLRDDEHVEYGDSLIRWLKADENGYIRAPKMI